MKFVLLASCLVATALAGAVYPGYATGGYAAGVGAGGLGVGGVGVGGVGVGGVGVGGVVLGGAGLGAAGAGLGGTGAAAVGVGGGAGLGGAGGGAGTGAASGVDKIKAFVEARNTAARRDTNQRWNDAAKSNGRIASDYGDSAERSHNGEQSAAGRWGNRAGNWDNSNSAAKRLADNAASNAYDANKLGHTSDANYGLNDQLWAQGNQWYQGARKNDDIDYAYDKKFDLRDSNNGGYEFAEHSDSHALDHLKDRAANYDRNVDKSALWASAADAQKAARQSAAASDAAASGSNWDKFSRKWDNYAGANGRNKDWSQSLDQSQGGKRDWSDARKHASDIYKDLATADGSYQRNAKAARGKAAQFGDETLAYGVAGVGGYAAKPGYGDAQGGYAKVGQAGDVAAAWDQAAKAGLKQTDAGASNERTQVNFARNQELSDRVKGFDRNKKAGAADAGFSDWAKQASQSARKADAARASAATAWNKDQNAESFNEDLWKKEAERKRLSDRNKNHKVYKKYFNNKRHGGDNWERLKYDRDQSDDAFGYDTAAKKDWGQRAGANKWNARYDANGRNSQAARAAAAGRNAHQADWRSNADGYKNAQAARNFEDEAKRNGNNAAAWKKAYDQNKFDSDSASARLADRGLGRAGFDIRAADAAGAGAGAGILGGGGAGAASVGLGAGGAAAVGAGGAGLGAAGVGFGNAGVGVADAGYGYGNAGVGVADAGYGYGYPAYGVAYPAAYGGATKYGLPAYGKGKGYAL